MDSRGEFQSKTFGCFESPLKLQGKNVKLLPERVSLEMDYCAINRKFMLVILDSISTCTVI